LAPNGGIVTLTNRLEAGEQRYLLAAQGTRIQKIGKNKDAVSRYAWLWKRCVKETRFPFPAQIQRATDDNGEIGCVAARCQVPTRNCDDVVVNIHLPKSLYQLAKHRVFSQPSERNAGTGEQAGKAVNLSDLNPGHEIGAVYGFF
jgi:hypothetical protein